MTREQYLSTWSKLHGDAEIRGIVRAWLAISYVTCRPLVVLRVSPNLVTLSSLALAVGYLWQIKSPWAIVLLTLSLALDGIDGTLAIMRSKISSFGALLDALMDRIVESLWIYGLFLLGVSWQILAIVWVASFIQEYMRARAGGLGESGIGIVTFAERPVRASLIFIALVFNQLEFNILNEVATVWAAMQCASALRLFISLRSRLRQSQR